MTKEKKMKLQQERDEKRKKSNNGISMNSFQNQLQDIKAQLQEEQEEIDNKNKELIDKIESIASKDDEVWKPINSGIKEVDDSNIYQISNQGRIKSKDRTIKKSNNTVMTIKGKILKQRSDMILKDIMNRYILVTIDSKKYYFNSIVAYVRTFIDENVTSINDFIFINDVNDVSIDKFYNSENFIITKGNYHLYHDNKEEAKFNTLKDILDYINKNIVKVKCQNIYDEDCFIIKDKDNHICVYLKDAPNTFFKIFKKNVKNNFYKNNKRKDQISGLTIINKGLLLDDEYTMNSKNIFTAKEMKKGLEIVAQSHKDKTVREEAQYLLKTNFNDGKLKDNTKCYIKKYKTGNYYLYLDFDNGAKDMASGKQYIKNSYYFIIINNEGNYLSDEATVNFLEDDQIEIDNVQWTDSFRKAKYIKPIDIETTHALIEGLKDMEQDKYIRYINITFNRAIDINK